MYWSTAFHVYTQLPFRPGRGFGELFRTHFFINAGNLSNVNFCKSSVLRVIHSRVTASLLIGNLDKV